MHATPGNVFMVVAPSGAGKSSLVKALLAQDP
ncbi:MAG: guanylate kinase, partial [Achromobacter mucicolens]